MPHGLHQVDRGASGSWICAWHGVGLTPMSRVRIHVPSGRWGSRMFLEPAERHYLVDVRRLSSGDQVEIFNGQGLAAQGELVQDSSGWAVALRSLPAETESGPQVHLGVALLKGRKLDDVVRMVTEIGVATIEPFFSERSIPRPHGKNLDLRLMRWRQIAIAAARQSGRNSVPSLSLVRPLEELLACGTPSARAILHEHAQGRTLAEFLATRTERRLLILVGPEGGFSSNEIARAQVAGFEEVRLGSLVLRAETAAVVGAAIACLDSKAFGRVRVKTEG